jgi:hypothetical protein
MIESELEIIKNKIKDETFDTDDLQECEKKILKIEKKLIQLENKFNKNTNNSDEFEKSNDSDNSDDSDDSDCDINVNKVIQDIDKLNTELTNINTNISIEKLIDNYIMFKQKISLLKSKNEEFKLKIDYL